jgi:hypothetical protein
MKKIFALAIILSLNSCWFFGGLIDPEAPSGLAIIEITDESLTLSWLDNSSQELGFRIERKEGTGGSYVQIASTNPDVTLYVDTGLTNNTTYYYRIRSYNDSGFSAYVGEGINTTTLPSAGTLNPIVTITNPADQATVSNPITVAFTVSDWDPDSTGTHIHPFLNGNNLGAHMSLSDIDLNSFYGGNLPSGFYTLTLKLANSDHTFIGVADTIEFTVP